MKIGEVCLYTGDVIKMANFYKAVLRVDNNSSDDVHQFILSDETTLTIYNDGGERAGNFQNVCLAFTVDDVDLEYERLTVLGIAVCEPPTVRPWGAKNMTFFDPENNPVTFRSFSA